MRHILVNVGDHAEKAGLIPLDAVQIGLPVFVRNPIRAVRRIRRNVGEKRLIAPVAALHPSHRLLEPDIGAVAPVLLDLIPMAVMVVKIVIPIVVGRGGDAEGGMVDRFMETAVLGPVGVVVAQMPLAEMTGVIAVVRQDIGHRRQVGAQQRTPHADERRPVAQSILARHQLAARRRTHGRHVKIGQTHAVGVDAVQRRRLQNWIAQAGQVPVSLVIRQHEDDIGTRLRVRH